MLAIYYKWAFIGQPFNQFIVIITCCVILQFQIEVGSTNVRVGSTIFGERFYGNKKSSTTNPASHTDSVASTSLGDPSSKETISGTSIDTKNIENTKESMEKLTMNN